MTDQISQSRSVGLESQPRVVPATGVSSRAEAVPTATGPGSLPRPSVAALMVLVALAVVSWSAGAAGAQSVLVSNIGQPHGDFLPIEDYDLAQSFTTGTNAEGYTLTSIELRLYSDDNTLSPAPTVKVLSGSATGTEVATLTGPNLAAQTAGNYAFTAPEGTTLSMSTTYWVVAVEGSSIDARWYSTEETDEDGTPATGWAIGDEGESRDSDETGAFDADDKSIFQMRVNGTENTPSNSTGKPSITGTAVVGRTLTAATGTIADPDGLPSTFAYQWIRVDGGDETDISNATLSTYTLLVPDQGKQVKVKVSFTDNAGNSESRTSDAYPTSGTVQRETTVGSVLLSNTDRSHHPGPQLWGPTYRKAQGFTTGSNAGGYTFQQVRVHIGAACTKPLAFALHAARDQDRNDASGPVPAEELAVLQGSGTPSGLRTFTPTTPVTLDPSKDYFIVMKYGSGSGTTPCKLRRVDTFIVNNAVRNGNCNNGGWCMHRSVRHTWVNHSPTSWYRGGTRWSFLHERTRMEIRGSTIEGNQQRGVGGRRGRSTKETPRGRSTEETPSGLTATFENAPSSHDGSTAFPVQLRFSEEVALSYKAFTNGLLTVTGGTVGKARRLNPPSNIGWQFPVTPAGIGDVVITLPANRACDVQPTVCTSDGRQLSQAPSVTVSGTGTGTETGTKAELTATFSNAPSSHDGSTAFPVQLRFSEEVALSYKAFTNGLLTATGGTVGKARRLNPPSNIGWQFPVTPAGNGDVVITLPANRACDVQPTVCTSDGRQLSQAPSVTVSGPGSSKAVVAPLRLELDANYPNPFNTETQIAYTLPAAGRVVLEIYNVLGQRERTLVEGPQSAGRYQIAWDGRNEGGVPVTSGVYFYRLTSEQGVLVRQLVLLK